MDKRHELVLKMISACCITGKVQGLSKWFQIIPTILKTLKTQVTNWIFDTDLQHLPVMHIKCVCTQNTCLQVELSS